MVEVGPPDWKVALVGFGMDLVSQMDGLAGHRFVLAQPGAALAGKMAEQAGRLVGPGVDQLVQDFEWPGQWIDLVAWKADHLAQKAEQAEQRVDLTEREVDRLAQKVERVEQRADPV